MPQPKRSSAQQAKLRAIASRGHPACHICGKPIDYSLPKDDPKSFVIDHVVPLKRGGRDDKTNVRAAHRDCNSTKRARVVAPIVRRSGSLS